MSRVYSFSFASGFITGDTSVEYDFPAGYVYVVRDVCGIIIARDTGGGKIVFGAGEDPQGFHVVHFPQKYVGPFQWSGRVVLPGPTKITVATPNTGSTAGASYFVSGYQLSLP